jgi:hypothetical protein
MSSSQPTGPRSTGLPNTSSQLPSSPAMSLNSKSSSAFPLHFLCGLACRPLVAFTLYAIPLVHKSPKSASPPLRLVFAV